MHKTIESGIGLHFLIEFNFIISQDQKDNRFIEEKVLCIVRTSYCIVFLEHVQNVPPPILLRFLREHRSEWADNSIDAYLAAAIKAGPCALPGIRLGSFGSQVILPLAHTIEHEEAS